MAMRICTSRGKQKKDIVLKSLLFLLKLFLFIKSTSKLFGGNSNWRGPIWFPMQFLLIEALERFDNFFGDSCAPFEFPARSGKKMSLGDITEDLWARLVSLFKKDKS